MFGRRPTPTQTRMMLDELAQSYFHFRNAAGHAAGGTAERLTPGYDRAREFASRRFSPSGARSASSPFAEQWRAGASNARRGWSTNAGGGRSGGGRSGSGRSGSGRSGSGRSGGDSRMGGGGWFGGGSGGTRNGNSNGSGGGLGAFMPLWSSQQRQKPNRGAWPRVGRLLLAGAAIGAATAIVRRRRQANQWEEFEPIPEVDDYGQRYGSSSHGNSGEFATRSGGNFHDAASKMGQGAHTLGDRAASLAHAVQGKANRLAEQLQERASRAPTDAELREGDPTLRPGAPGPASGLTDYSGRPQETTTFSGFAESLDDDLGNR